MQIAPRSDDEVQAAAKALFLGCAPERASEIEAMWTALQPRFHLTDDVHEGERFILDAGLFRDIRFNHRVMRSFWLAGFIAWEGYQAVQAAVAKGCEPSAANLDRFRALIGVFDSCITSNEPQLEPLPDHIPEPGSYPGSQQPELQAPAELATIAVGWAFLHEVRHIKHQQAGTGASQHDKAEAFHREELSCDSFATTFLLENIPEFAQQYGLDEEQVSRKRRLGIYFALFLITLVCKNRWGESNTHPSVQRRMDAVLNIYSRCDPDEADAVAFAAFQALSFALPGTPIPPFPKRTQTSDSCVPRA